MPELPPSFTPGFYDQFQSNLNRKYDILGEHAKADTLRAQTDASTLPGLREAQSFAARSGGQLDVERGLSEAKVRQFYDNPAAVDMLHDVARQGGYLPMRIPGAGMPGMGIPGGTPGVGASAPVQLNQLPSSSLAPTTLPPSTFAPASTGLGPQSSLISPQLQTPEQLAQSTASRRRQQMAQLQLPSLIRPLGQQVGIGLQEGTEDVEPYRKGSADVKGKGGKASPKGLEAMLPMLMAAMQGGGAAGPPAPAPAPAPAPPGAGLKKGSANVKGYKKGSANVRSKGKESKSSKSSDPPAGLEDLLAALAGGGAGAAGPQAAPALPMPMAPGAAAPPGFAVGTPSVQPMPGYPFGAGYLFGAPTVPGEGSGMTDTVPAMLAPHEAVLNRAAADMLGRGLIAALNQRGVRQMGMGRGAAT